MNREQIIDLFLKKPRHAGKLLSTNQTIEKCKGRSVPEKAFNYCYPGSAEKFKGCLNCHKEFNNFISFNQGYRQYCSPKCAMTDQSLIKRREASCISKYGVKNPLASKYARQRLQEVSLQRYGTVTPVASSIVQATVKRNLLERYGVDHAFKVDAVKKKARERYIEKYVAVKWPKRLKVIEEICKVELIGDRSYLGEAAIYRWKHSCGTIFESKVSSGFILSCPTCKESFVSHGEKELAEFLMQFGSIQTQVRDLIQPYELDIFIKAQNLAFEYNGDYFHSTEVKQNKNYHLNKLNRCETLGIRLIHVFEHQWQTKRSIVESRIKSILGKNDRIYARQCTIREVEEVTASVFCEENHLQGSVGSKRRVGLFFKEELVALMTFGKPRFNVKYDWELLRYCTKLGLNVVGGPSRLFKAAGYENMITYADRCWSNGSLYRQLGFEELLPSPPSYFYVRNGLRLSRYQTQKHKLKVLLGDRFDEELSEVDNMKNAKYHQIYDCGNRVFHYKPKE
jgi:hypothetical protein